MTNETSSDLPKSWAGNEPQDEPKSEAPSEPANGSPPDHEDIHCESSPSPTQVFGSESLLGPTEYCLPPSSKEFATVRDRNEEMGTGAAVLREARANNVEPSPAYAGLGDALSENRQRPPVVASAAPRTDLRFVILATWASLATILCIWIWWRQPEPATPLENLPDDGVHRESGRIVSPLEPLSARYLLPIGQTRQFGMLRITPLSIENRSVRLLPDKFHTAKLLVLRLQLENASRDQVFHPLDPAFLYPDPKKKLSGLSVFDRGGYAYTFIHPVGSLAKIVMPLDLAYKQGFQVEGQVLEPLAPGETTESIVVSQEDAFDQLDAHMIWRIKLRKGMAKSRVGIATVVGIIFDKAQVRQVEANEAERRVAESPEEISQLRL